MPNLPPTVLIALGIFAIWEAYVTLWPRRIYPPVRHATFTTLGILAARLLDPGDAFGQDVLVGLAAAGLAVLINMLYHSLLAFADEKTLAVQALAGRTSRPRRQVVEPPATVGHRLPPSL